MPRRIPLAGPLTWLFAVYMLTSPVRLALSQLPPVGTRSDESLSNIPIPLPSDFEASRTVGPQNAGVPKPMAFDRPIRVIESPPLDGSLPNASAVDMATPDEPFERPEVASQLTTSVLDEVDHNPWRQSQRNKHSPRRYLEADFLLWWAGNSTSPPLLTSNPAGTSINDAGLMGSPSTSIIDGNETVGDWPHPGIRLRAGRYLDNSVLSRVELGFWHLFEGQDSFTTQSTDGEPILGRPFFDSSFGGDNSQLISYPGIADGSFESRYTRQAIGVDPLFFICLESNRCRWWEFYTGYRFLWLRDAITLRESAELAPGGFVAPGSRFDIEDNFEAGNAYHLIPLGLSLSGNRGQWIWNMRGDIGLGFVQQMVEVHGSTRDFTNNELTGSYDAGLLALNTNSGRHDRSRFAWVPQLSLSLRRQLNERTSATLGYTLINLNQAVQAVDHIPTVIDSRNIPPVLPGAGPDPTFAFLDRSLLIHGFNFGLNYRF